MIRGGLPYELATQIYKQGIECDRAAGVIRRTLEEYLKNVRETVKEELGKDYKKEWETEIKISPYY
jgi:sulfite reductase beta subunit-like hemoprotein